MFLNTSISLDRCVVLMGSAYLKRVLKSFQMICSAFVKIQEKF